MPDRGITELICELALDPKDSNCARLMGMIDADGDNWLMLRVAGSALQRISELANGGGLFSASIVYHPPDDSIH
jgi:hypothetical protein